MKIKNIFSSSHVGWLVVFAALIFWYFFYFFSYIPNQEAKLRKRGYRILEEFTGNMLEKHKYYENHFENFGPFYYLRDSGFTINSGSKKQQAIKTTIEALNQDIVRTSQKDSSLFKKHKNKPSFYFYHPEHNEAFIVPVKTFMEGLKFDRLFESIVFFDSTEVFYNSDSEIVYNITNPKSIVDSVQNRQGGFDRMISVRGEKKRVLVLPFDLVGKRFYLAGVISDSAFKSKTRSINFQFLILISGLLLVLLIGMPVLKILLIDSYDHLDASDPHRVIISLIVGTGVLAIISFGSTYHKVVDRKYQKERLEQISDDVYKNIETDLKSIFTFSNNIISENDLLASGASQMLSDSVFPSLETDAIFPLNELILINSGGKAEAVYAVSKKLNLSFDTTFNGVKFDTINLETRLYFLNAADTTKSWYDDTLKRHFFIQSITSYNTGYKEAALSLSVYPKVFAITSPVPSLFNQILPNDAEFAVISANGEVLFHSRQSKNLHENFLDESSFSQHVNNAVTLRTVETARVTYNEKSWLVRLKPIKNTPLTLVTLLDIEKMQQRNTRVILFTFYFFAVTMLCILVWMLVLRAIRFENDKIKTKSWLFNWLHFDADNHSRYKQFLVIILLTIVLQAVGGFIIKKPITMLVYQLCLISYTGISGAVVLGKMDFHKQKFYHKEDLPKVMLLLFFAVVSVLMLSLQIVLVIPLVVLLAVTFYLFRSAEGHVKSTGLSLKGKRTLYNICLFLWMLSLSFVPVVMYYYSIQKQEVEIWHRSQMLELAEKSLDAAATSSGKYIHSSGFKGLNFEYTATQKFPERNVENDSTVVDKIYGLLADPLTEERFTLLQNRSFYPEWNLMNDTLLYSNPVRAGFVRITSDGSGKRNPLWWLFLLIPASVVLLFLWFVVNYVNEYILYTKQDKWERQNQFGIDELISETAPKRILVNTFSENELREKALKIFDDKVKSAANSRLVIISATSLLSDDFKPEEIIKGENKTFWISELEQCIYQAGKHDLLLDRLRKISFYAEGRILLIVPFEPVFISEYYEEHFNSPESKSVYLRLKQAWKIIFKEYNHYYISKLEPDKTDQVVAEHSRKKLFYSFIWNNLSRNEKLVLYDLAEDGLINLKNKKMIDRLLQKGLIRYDKYLKPFSDSFQYFVTTSINTEEKKTLESSATFRGMWQSMRYPIVIVLVIVAAFVFISQGYSFEKVTAVFAGVLTLMATMTKLFEGK